MRKTAVLRRLLDGKKIVVAPGCYNAYTAKIIEKVGFEAVYMSGGGTSRSFGLPDVGFQTLTEVSENIRHIADTVNIPLIADADTGFGNAVHVTRAVKEYIRAGAAAMHIEDQIFFKRCGYLAGKVLTSLEEAVGKYKAADLSRREEDEDFVIIARTDAMTALGGGLEDVIRRGNAYAEAGADMIFPSPPFKSVHDVERLVKEIQAPILYNWGEPKLSIDTLQEMGFAVVIFAGLSETATRNAVWDLAYALKSKGAQAMTEYEQQMKGHGLPYDVHTFSGIPEIRELEKRFLPKEENTSR